MSSLHVSQEWLINNTFAAVHGGFMRETLGDGGRPLFWQLCLLPYSEGLISLSFLPFDPHSFPFFSLFFLYPFLQNYHGR